MPVQQTIIDVTPGEWVPLCELRELRKSLRIEPSQGVLVCSQTNSGEAVPTMSGSIPAGFAVSPDTDTYPASFHLSSELDGDLVTQQWYGWLTLQVYPGQISWPGQYALNDNYDVAIDNAAVQYDLPAGTLLATTVSSAYDLSPPPPSIRVASQGVIAPLLSKTVVSASSDAYITIAVYTWQHQGGKDSFWPAVVLEGTYQEAFLTANLYSIGGATALDKSASANGVASPATVTTAATTQALEVAFGVIAVAGDTTQSISTPAGWNPLFGFALVGSSGGDSIFTQEFTRSLIATGAVTLSVPVTGGLTSWAAILVTIKYQAPGPIAVAVIEAFDLDAAEPENYLTVQLPTIGEDAKKHLVELQRKILGSAAPPVIPEEEPDEVSDPTV